MTPSRSRRRNKFTRLIKGKTLEGLLSCACNKMTMMNVQPTTKIFESFLLIGKEEFFVQKMLNSFFSGVCVCVKDWVVVLGIQWIMFFNGNTTVDYAFTGIFPPVCIGAPLCV